MQYTVLNDLDGYRDGLYISPLNWDPPLLPAENRTYDASVVVVSFNTRDLLRACLELVQREAKGLRIEALIVDNNSIDGSAEMVEKDFPDFRIIHSAVNLGFGAANNLAIKSARGRYLILLNSDAFLQPGALKLAIEHMDQQPKAALGGARLLSQDDSFQPSARMFPNIVTDTFVLTGLAARYQKSRIFGYFDRTWADPSQPCQADWVPGAFSIIRADVLDKVGLFDPIFFLYGEEVDLCRRIKKAGYEIWYWPDISVLHIGVSHHARSRILRSLLPVARNLSCGVCAAPCSTIGSIMERRCGWPNGSNLTSTASPTSGTDSAAIPSEDCAAKTPITLRP